MKKLGFLAFVLSVGLIVAACAQINSGTSLPNTGGAQNPLNYADLPSAAQAVVEQLRTQLKVPIEQIQVLEVTPVQWPDACLGLPKSGESCAQVITNGYRVIVRIGNQQYEFHTDQNGASIRQK